MSTFPGSHMYAIVKRYDAIKAAFAAANAPLPLAIARRVEAAERVESLRYQSIDIDAVLERLRPADLDEIEGIINEAAAEAAQRAAAADLLNLIPAEVWWTEVGSAITNGHGDIAAALSPMFTAAVKSLTAASRKLPDEANPLDDPNKVLAHGAGTAWTKANEALATLNLVAAATDVNIHSWQLDGLPGRDHLSKLLAIVTVPDLEPDDKPRHKPSAKTQNRRLLQQLRDHGINATLVRVARGDWPQITLTMTQTAGESLARAERLRNTETATALQPKTRRGQIMVIR